MINRLEILAKIDEIEDTHCIECPVSSSDRPIKCLPCPYGKEIEKLGDQLMLPSQKIKDDLLAKGENMTMWDTLYQKAWHVRK